MDQDTFSQLEFPEVVELIKGFAQTTLGQARLSETGPIADPGLLQLELELLDEAWRFTTASGRPAFGALDDPDNALRQINLPGSSGRPEEFLLLLRFLQAYEDLSLRFDSAVWPRLSRAFPRIRNARAIIQRIERTLEPTGEIRESAFPKLKEVRRQQIRLRERIEKLLQQSFQGQDARFLIDEPFVTIRNNRFVIPVRAAHRKSLQGVVHGSSSSGATLFLEPYSAVDLNNRMLLFEERQAEMVLEILRNLSEFLRCHRDDLRLAVERVAMADALFAKVEFAVRFRCIVPGLREDRKMQLLKMRHPLLVESLGRDQVVPISVEMSAESGVLVISGPNAGGKTVALKTIGLLCLMALCGLPLPCAHAQVPRFRRLLVDIGDHQSIDQRLSTFSAHLLRIQRMLEQLEHPSLILVDELGSWTDPSYAGALGIAILEVFAKRGAQVVATTHHPEIRQYALTTPHVISAGVTLDKDSLEPTFRLQVGLAGGSNSLEVAARLGCSPEILESARSHLDQKALQAEEYLSFLRTELERALIGREALDRERIELELEKSNLRVRTQSEIKVLKETAEAKLEEWLQEFRQEMNRFLARLEERREAARARKEQQLKEGLIKDRFRRKMSEQFQPPDESGTTSQPAPNSLAVGDPVFHRLFRKTGRVLSVEGDDVVVEVEGKRITSAFNQIEPTASDLSRIGVAAHVRVNVETDSQTDLNLIGKAVEDAIERLDKFLDRAFLSELSEIRVIHGFGKGKLRVAINEFLKDHPHVLKCRVEGGATLVVLRL